MLVIDKCAYTNNLKDKNATIKLVIAMAGICISMIITSIYVYIGIIILASIAIIYLAKIDIKIYKTCLKIPLYFLLLSIFINLINISVNNDNLTYSIKVINVYLGV
ncbi:MAG: cobalt ECF transporter T component CbiQ, partial [Paraclostridium sp.]